MNRFQAEIFAKNTREIQALREPAFHLLFTLLWEPIGGDIGLFRKVFKQAVCSVVPASRATATDDQSLQYPLSC